jgi:hypothetical protein
MAFLCRCIDGNSVAITHGRVSLRGPGDPPFIFFSDFCVGLDLTLQSFFLTIRAALIAKEVNAMRWMSVVVLLLPLTAAAELVDRATDRQLCQAALLDSALPETVNTLFQEQRMNFADAPALLELDCSGRTLLRTLLDERQAENLAYVVIDLGVSLDTRIDTGAGTMSLSAWLKHQGDKHENPEVREFARTYRDRFRDASFNPNLLVSTD